MVRKDFYTKRQFKHIRLGFGEGLVEAGETDKRVVALSADLTESVHMHHFKEKFEDRFVQVGVAEQNLVTLASGMAHAGKIPFAGSYAAFSPGRNWEQIRTTIALNNQPVKLVGSHAGLTVGPDGATHQVLEDIAMMRSLPNMTVIVPGDAEEAKLATIEAAKYNKPVYLRLTRDETALFKNGPFEIGRVYTLIEGEDVTLMGTGFMTSHLLDVAVELGHLGINAEVLHVPTIKPLDETAIMLSAAKTGRVVTLEDGQVAGGFGSAIAELMSEKLPTPVRRLGVQDRFGQSGKGFELLKEYWLDPPSVLRSVLEFIEVTPRYHQ